MHVLGGLTRNNALVPYMGAGKVETSVLVEGFEQFRQQITQTPSVLLDHAPLLRSPECIVQIPPWVQKGCIVQYWPPYAPEGHLSESLWRFMQYSWLPFAAFVSCPKLGEAIEEILTRGGTE